VQTRIRSERTRAANLPFSDAIWAGDTLYLSGHLGLDHQTGKPPASAADEAPMPTPAITEQSIPKRMTLRVPYLSPAIPQMNCPTA